MRIRRVEICGFGPFKEPQEVDFTAFDADGLFLISGETGAGKSTILDAVAYALYGDTPRWDDLKNATPRFRSDFCGPDDPTRVVLEFETNGERYRITRNPEYLRSKANGSGTTPQKAAALLEQRTDDGDWVALATRLGDVAARVAELVHLTKDEFGQVILLAQGRFHRFLLAPREERLTLLSKLFGARRFADYQAMVADRRKDLRDATAQARFRQEALLEAVRAGDAMGVPEPGSELAWLDGVLAAAEADARTAADRENDATAAEAAAAHRLDVAVRQRRRRDAADALTALAARATEVDEVRRAVATAERAERVRALVDAAAAAEDAVEAGRACVDDLRATCGTALPDDALAGEVSRLDQEIGPLVRALADETRLRDLTAEVASARKEAAERLAERDALTAQVAAVTAERDLLVPVAAQAEALAERREALQARLAAADQADAVEARLRDAEDEQRSADRAYATALSRASDLFERHLHGQAASLASVLVPGEPCAVCGSREHPAPATRSSDVVDRAAVDAAKVEADNRERVSKSAAMLVQQLRTESAGLRGIAGDADAGILRTDLARADDALEVATAARARVMAIDAALDGTDGLRARTVAAQDAVDAAQTRVTALSTTAAELRAALDLLRGEHASVRERHDALRSRRDRTRSLLEAVAALDAATGALSTAQAQLAAKATAEGFASPADAVAALQPADALARLHRVVADHDEAVNRARGQLAAPDLQDLPPEPVDVDDARTQAELAHEQRSHAASASVEAAVRRTQLAEQRERLAELLAAAADLAADQAVLERLAATLNGRPPNATGMSLESYFVAAELEEVLAAANVRLRSMTGGRFQLQHTERGVLHASARAGLELEVMDEHTGKERDPHTLSGGEQFLTSLALALGLAEVVTGRAGGVELDTLFVDEGFGSLSPEYLEIAMATLDSLKAGGRTVGVISHVDAMTSSIAAQLHVVKDPGGGSRVLA